MRVPNLGETELLVPLHDGVFEQPMWHTFLERLRAVTKAKGTAMLVRAPGGSDLRLEMGDCDALRVFHHATVMREGRVYSSNELSTNGTDPSARALSVCENDGVEIRLAIVEGEASGVEIASLLTALAPHLRVALRVLASLERERGRASLRADAIRRMDFGWVAIDERCRIIDCDPHAERFLRQSGSLRRGPYDRLTPSQPAIDRQLTALVREFASDRASRPRAINLSQDPWIDILVAPLRIEALSGDARAVAAIYLRDDKSSSADRHEQLVDLFDLTPAEARLAWSLAQGMSIAEAAGAHGLTVETARYYSKKIYAKTGARGQVDLVRNILTGVLALA